MKFKEFNLQTAQLWMLSGFVITVLGCIGLVGNIVFQTWNLATTFGAFCVMGILLMKVSANYYVHLFRENRDNDSRNNE